MDKRPFGILTLILILGILVLIFWYRQSATVPPPVAVVVTPEVEPIATTTDTTEVLSEAEVVAQFFTPLTPMTIGSTSLLVSVAQTPEERTRGLSGSPYLPVGIGKFFVFDGPGRWGIWMKDMLYSIDIIWLDAAGFIVHIEEQVSPDTYPRAFTPTSDSQYVLEVNAGFVSEFDLAVGDQAELAEILQ